ncbi:uncharacterized protein EV420DRAFT_1647606 [Desarmillaria tabescens]|uniref:DUF6535 domain-containing protein n=1 Tax=Armillaria tabescens TaxID=1929756 RepID=A0AA39JS16_ARMTA|nr:uncharacterized protein EV420DRAFT_1647606 [Desarmillaria tabescens]KAK0447865.1 hypothetical protein EV420DRAFT_1647606 [Desarmillaria tabescens]
MPSSTVSDDASEKKPAEGETQLDNDEGPEVENSTYYSSRRRKSSRGLMGVKTREYLVKENDPFDYEQKFPEDKQYEELGPAARVWRTYLEECAGFDIEMVEGWRDGLDVLLVFAGLFSAVVTTFVAQTSQSLQVDYGQVTSSLLFELIDVQRVRSQWFPQFRPTTSDSLVNGLWFTSLSFSLTTALFAVLTKQWIHQYMTVRSGTPRDRCRVRHFRYMGLQQWRVAFIIGLLPVLMSASLCVFLVGLVVFLVPLQVPIASVVGAVTFISFAAYFVTNFLPIIYPSCPYKTPLSQYIFPLYSHIAHNGIFTSVISPISRYWSGSSPVPKKPPIRTLREAEREAVKLSADETDARALSWLFSVSSDPSVQRIVVESTGALPIRSVNSVQRYAEGLPSVCAYTLKELLDDAQRSDALVDTSKMDRCIRAHLRFQFWDAYIGIYSRQDQLAPDLRAELLATETYMDCRNVQDLIVANLRTPPVSQSLCLQPIVWGCLLSKILPLDREVYELLFHALPTIYWHADYKLPPHFLPNKGLPISMIPTGDRPETLFVAISESLFASIGDILLQGGASFMVQDSVFYRDPTSQLSEPNDPRVRFLLNMAGSPSIHRMEALDSSRGTLFSAILWSIMAYMGVENYMIHLSAGNVSPILLDNNRSAILRLLYMLVLSDECGVGSDSMFAEDRCITLIAFFRVLNCISPRPPEDSFPAELVAKFVSIAFQDDTWFSDAPYATITEAAELIIFLFEHSSTMNAAFAHFVDKQLFDLFTKNSSTVSIPTTTWGLSRIIGAFVAGLSSGKLDPQIRQRSLEYLHEPGSLHTACAVLITQDNIPALHQLALLRCNDPVWPRCLQSLQEIDVLDPTYDWRGYGLTSRYIADLKAFIERNCVELGTDTYGSGTAPDVRSVRGNDEPAKSAWSKVMSRSHLLHWARRHRTREALPEEVAISSNR